jgi:hypothetical protein
MSWVCLLVIINLRGSLQCHEVCKLEGQHREKSAINSQHVKEYDERVDVSELRRQIFALKPKQYRHLEIIEKLKSRLELEPRRGTPLTNQSENYFSHQVSDFMVGVSRIPADDLLQQFDPGLPRIRSQGSEEDWLFYSSSAVVPSSLTQNFDRLPVTDALSKCHSVELIARHDTEGHACFSLVGIPEAGLIPNTFRWFNQHCTTDRDVEPETKFSHAGRGMVAGYEDDAFPMVKDDVLQRRFWRELSAYMSILDDILIPSIRPILEKKAIEIDDAGKTLVIMVTNAGHADLVQNFVCNSKARNFDISNVVVFCTDAEAEQRVKVMGLGAIYNAQLFANAVPKDEAKEFGDGTFVAAVSAKLVVAHLVSVMGFSFLLQDVDVVWYDGNPLSFFQNNGLVETYDVLVQDDGGRTQNYAPYFAYSGFYFAKNNEKTRYFFQQVLFRLDRIVDWGSDQKVFNSVLPEVINLLGMSVKTLAPFDFAAGRAYQDPHSYGYMREMLTKKTRAPVVFHMNWTENKTQKIIQMKQMGMWYLHATTRQRYKCTPEPMIECTHWNRPSVPICRASKINSL